MTIAEIQQQWHDASPRIPDGWDLSVHVEETGAPCVVAVGPDGSGASITWWVDGSDAHRSPIVDGADGRADGGEEIASVMWAHARIEGEGEGEEEEIWHWEAGGAGGFAASQDAAQYLARLAIEDEGEGGEQIEFLTEASWVSRT